MPVSKIKFIFISPPLTDRVRLTTRLEDARNNFLRHSGANSLILGNQYLGVLNLSSIFQKVVGLSYFIIFQVKKTNNGRHWLSKLGKIYVLSLIFS